MSKVVEILKAARASITDPANWTQGEYAKNADGDSLDEREWEAQAPACFCSVGAVAKAGAMSVCDAENSAAVVYLGKAIGSKLPCAIVEYNDEHTHEEVLAAFDKAIALAEKELVVTNLETLLAAVEAQPDEQFNLSDYSNETECGTMYCTAGLAATLPHFNAQGMYWGLGMYGGPEVKVGNGTVNDDDETDQRFGLDAWYILFASYGFGKLDKELGAYAPEDAYQRTRLLKDKELAIARLKAQIKFIKGEAA